MRLRATPEVREAEVALLEGLLEGLVYFDEEAP